MSQPTEDAPVQIDEVVVNARADEVRTSIDSVSYGLVDDLQAASGTLAEALRNIPSVEVDPDGNVSLRGDTSVTILIDGRPASQFSGPSRGPLVLQSPANRYARIEIMTNPSAAYSPEGSGGVINLISKPGAPPQGETTSGSLRASIGDSGRWNGGATLAHVAGQTTLSTELNLRRDAFRQEIDRVRTRIDSATGSASDARQQQRVEGDSEAAFGRLALEHNLDAKTQWTGEIRASKTDNLGVGFEIYEADAPGAAAAEAYERTSFGGFRGQSAGGSTRVLRRFDDQGHEWSGEFRYDLNRFTFGTDAVLSRSAPMAQTQIENAETRNRQSQFGASSAYVRPFADDSRLRAGYDLQILDLALTNVVERGPSPETLSVDPIVSNEFKVKQQVHAVYSTYEKQLSERFSAQAGLRLEWAAVDTDQVTTGVQAKNDYVRVYPTGHLAYSLGEGESLRGSYSRRIQRPPPAFLNPFATFQDRLTYRSGNPNLLPQTTDSFELLYQKRAGQNFYQATLYLRDTQDAFTDFTTDLGGGVLVTRPENLGSSRFTGLELVANGAILSTLRYSASLNAYRQEIDANSIPGATVREGQGVGGRLTLNWQPTQEDFLQLTQVWTGTQLLAQGERRIEPMVNFGYRRKLNEDWSFSLTARDLLDAYGASTTIQSAVFTDRTDATFGGRALYAGLTWNFGSAAQKPEQFDFSEPQPGG